MCSIMFPIWSYFLIYKINFVNLYVFIIHIIQLICKKIINIPKFNEQMLL